MTPLTHPRKSPRAKLGGRRWWWPAGFFVACLAIAVALAAAMPAWAGQDAQAATDHLGAQGGRRLALLVGVGSFADPAFTSLSYAHNDVAAMQKWLTSPEGGGFRKRDVTVLLDGQATRAAIMGQAQRLAEQTGPEDLVLLYFSTHGFLTTEQVAGVVCYDTRSTGHLDSSGSPIVFRDQSLTRDDLYHFLAGLPAQRRAVIVDICHGGQLAGEKTPAEANTTGGERVQASGNPMRTTLVLASCLGSERSWESRELESSIFTHYILEGLKKFHGDLVAAFNLAREETERQSKCEKGICQTPYLVRQPPDRGLSLAPPRREG